MISHFNEVVYDNAKAKRKVIKQNLTVEEVKNALDDLQHSLTILICFNLFNSLNKFKEKNCAIKFTTLVSIIERNKTLFLEFYQ